MNKKLKIENLNFSIRDKSILNNINLDIEENKFIGLIGPNGSGKSTLLKNIYRVLSPDSGTIYLDSEDISNLKPKDIAKKMAVLVQESNFEFDMKVIDLVLLGRYAYGTLFSNHTDEDYEICENALEKVGMSSYRNRNFFSLSGGEKQRILLARVLAQSSDIIILDEPTNHLDIGYQHQILGLLKDEDVTVFSSLHDLNMAAIFCDKIIAIYKGEIVGYDTPENLFTTDFIKNIFHIDSDVSINPITNKVQIYYLPENLDGLS